jgi:hypothetical protein
LGWEHPTTQQLEETVLYLKAEQELSELGWLVFDGDDAGELAVRADDITIKKLWLVCGRQEVYLDTGPGLFGLGERADELMKAGQLSLKQDGGNQ